MLPAATQPRLWLAKPAPICHMKLALPPCQLSFLFFLQFSLWLAWYPHVAPDLAQLKPANHAFSFKLETLGLSKCWRFQPRAAAINELRSIWQGTSCDKQQQEEKSLFRWRNNVIRTLRMFHFHMFHFFSFLKNHTDARGEETFWGETSRSHAHRKRAFLSNMTLTPFTRRSVSIKITEHVCLFDTNNERWSALTLMYPYRNRLFNLWFNLLGSTRAWLTLLTRWNSGGKNMRAKKKKKMKQLHRWKGDR